MVGERTLLNVNDVDFDHRGKYFFEMLAEGVCSALQCSCGTDFMQPNFQGDQRSKGN